MKSMLMSVNDVVGTGSGCIALDRPHFLFCIVDRLGILLYILYSVFVVFSSKTCWQPLLL